MALEFRREVYVGHNNGTMKANKYTWGESGSGAEAQ